MFRENIWIFRLQGVQLPPIYLLRQCMYTKISGKYESLFIQNLVKKQLAQTKEHKVH